MKVDLISLHTLVGLSRFNLVAHSCRATQEVKTKYLGMPQTFKNYKFFFLSKDEKKTT